MGLTRAFLHAGARSLLTTLWKVHPDTTSELVEHFYTLLRQGKGRAKAIQLAQAEVMKEHEDPYYWAPFALIGNWT